MNDEPIYKKKNKKLTEFLANEVVCGATKSIPFDFLDMVDKVLSGYEPPYTRHGIIGELVAFRKVGLTFNDTLNYLLKHKYIRATADTHKLFILTERGEKAQDKGDVKRFENSESWDRFIKRSRDFLVTFLFPFITVILLFPQTCGTTSVKIKDPIKVILDSTAFANHNNQSCNTDTIPCDTTNNVKP